MSEVTPRTRRQAKRQLRVGEEQWPLREPFVISSLAPVDHAHVVVVEIEQDGLVGRGECEAADKVDASCDSPLVHIEAARQAIENGVDRARLLELMPPGCGRNAIDCALLELEMKRAGLSVWDVFAGDAPTFEITTVFTISLGTPEKMAASARANAHRPILKLKIGSREGDLERVAAVREAAPRARISVDANTSWTRAQLLDLMPRLAELDVELIEQPFPAGCESWLDRIERVLPIAADESCHDRRSLPALAGRFDYVNIKLDKTGGVTEALLLVEAAKAQGFRIMVGCNVGTSLAMCPALIIARMAAFVDLDGPLLLSRDREPALAYDGSTIRFSRPAPWG